MGSVDNITSLEQATPEQRGDKDFVLPFLEKPNAWQFRYLSEDLKKNKEVVVFAVEGNPYNLIHVDYELRGDIYGDEIPIHELPSREANKDVVIPAVKRDGTLLEYASDELLSDRDVILSSISSWYTTAFRLASDDLRNDRNFNLEVMKDYGYALEYATDKFRRDIYGDEIPIHGLPFREANKEVVLKAVNSADFALQYACEELRMDKEIVMVSVLRHGASLEFASEELRGDKEVVSAAVSNYGPALQFASEELRRDKELILAAVKNDGKVLEILEDNLKDDKDIVLEAVSQYGPSLQFASHILRRDKEVIIAAVEESRYSLECVDNDLLDDKDFILQIFNVDARALQFASERLKDREDIILSAISKDPYVLKYASKRIRDILEHMKDDNGDNRAPEDTFNDLKWHMKMKNAKSARGVA